MRDFRDGGGGAIWVLTQCLFSIKLKTMNLYEIFKRGADLVISLLALIILSPFFAVIAIAINAGQ